MVYDLFISYSSHDRAWARKLTKDLEARGVKCFLDEERLTKGEKWEPQLVRNLLDSKHFLVVWSQKAGDSDWVKEELYRWKAHIDPTGAGPLPGRLLFAINLQSHNQTLSGFQGFYADSGVQGAYRTFLDDAARLGSPVQFLNPLPAEIQGTWDKWVAEIAGGAISNTLPLQMPVAVLALTTEILKTSPLEIPEFDFVAEREMDVFLQHLGAADSIRFNHRYGATPLDWHPTATAETVQTLLNELLTDRHTGINLKLTELGKPAVEWRFIDVVTPPLNRVALEAQPLVSGPCLIVIDPVSLFSNNIYKRYQRLTKCFLNPQAAIVFLTPFDSDPLVYLRRCLAEQGKPHLEWFHDPIPFNPAYANCGLNIADRWDIRRLVLASLGRQPSAQQSNAGEHILN